LEFFPQSFSDSRCGLFSTALSGAATDSRAQLSHLDLRFHSEDTYPLAAAPAPK